MAQPMSGDGNPAYGADVAIPGYVIRRKIADGGSASIYKAKKQPYEQIVALKVLLPKHMADKEMVRAFEREAGVLEKLKHKNIIKFNERVKGAPRPTYEMEFFESLTLKALIGKREGKVPVVEAAKVFLQAAEALAYIHVLDLAHLDLKPENILVNEATLEVRLIDFSIAKETKRSFLGRLMGGGGDTGKVQGTITYLSPEQIRQTDPGAKADVYALGLTLYAALTGSPPFRGHDQKSLMKQPLQDAPPPIEKARPELPVALAALVKKMLEKDPAKRPDMTGVAQVLAKLAG